jgi:hypothetical protein
MFTWSFHGFSSDQKNPEPLFTLASTFREEKVLMQRFSLLQATTVASNCSIEYNEVWLSNKKTTPPKKGVHCWGCNFYLI